MFTTRNYSSNESSDLAKVLNFVQDCYDLLDSPFLNLFMNLPVYQTYNVNSGHKNLDQISQSFYGSPFYTFFIMYYNNLQTEILVENTVLNMFNLDDFYTLYQQVSNGAIE